MFDILKKNEPLSEEWNDLLNIISLSKLRSQDEKPKREKNNLHPEIINVKNEGNLWQYVD